MTELRQRMLDAMVQRGLASRTQDTYIRAIRRMAKHYRRDPAQYTPAEVQAYLLHMVKDEHLSYSTMNQAACAAQFLFQTVLGHGREQFHIPFAKVPARQPELLARQEISRLFAVCPHPGRRMLNRPGFELTPRSWTNFKGFHEEVQNRVQARGRQELLGR